ncbi:MAG: hypothetical protein ABW022_15705 [Actinoplanes sp.]
MAIDEDAPLVKAQRDATNLMATIQGLLASRRHGAVECDHIVDDGIASGAETAYARVTAAHIASERGQLAHHLNQAADAIRAERRLLAGLVEHAAEQNRRAGARHGR